MKTSYVVDGSSNALTRILVMTKGDDTTYFVYGTGLIAQEKGDEYLTYHFNNIGNTQAVTNEIGEIVESFDYGPYGELLSDNTCGIMFLYSGEYGVSTDDNGLYYMRARYYNPEIKRFINQDVVIGSITDSPTLNRYAYVNGNPISLNDPFGLSPLLNWLGGITGHDVLDVLGMLPGVGFVFDGINAIWYAAEGDYFNAACSFVSALPGVGDAFSAFSKAGKSCKLVTAFHKAGAAGNLILGSYTLGNIADKYLFGEGDITWEEVKQDLFTVAMTGTSMWGSAKDFGTSYCFVAGTLVTTEDGQKPIEEIEVGDKVLSENELTGEVAVKTVTETYVNETDELIHIGVNGETISATPSHPFYVNKFGWTLAGSLRAGDVLVLSNGELVTVEWVQHEILESPIKVYNFEVEDFHTYFVGENSVLVHNDCPELTRKQQHQIEDLRSGKDVSVKTVDEARELLDNMPEVSAPPLGKMNPEFPDPKGTYRGDLFNAVLYDDLGNAYLADFIHAPNIVQKNPLHAQYPHYNIYFPDGEKAAILITG